MNSRRARRLAGSGALIGAVSGIAAYVRSSITNSIVDPERDEAFVGLRAPVEILTDEWGVPAIRAANEHDLFFTQGVIHANERGFMMEVMRRAAHGRLAELIGSPALSSDRLMRTFGFSAAARAELPLLSADARGAVEAYAAGVSAYFSDRSRRELGPEWVLLAHSPERWLPEDSLIVSRLFSLGLGGNWEAELVRAEIAERHGDALLALFDDDDDARDMTLPHLSADVLKDVRRSTGRIRRMLRGGDAAGSNAWVVSGEKTATGSPMLAGDTHLDLSLPCSWYEVALDAPSYSVRGLGIPGAPGIICGTNQQIAWTLTNSTADVQDLAIEEVDDGLDAYRDKANRWQPLRVRTEAIKVRGGKTRHHRVRISPRGPLLTDGVSHHMEQTTHLALRWPAGTEPGTLAEATYRLGLATDVESFRAAAAFWSAPSQNLLYADRDGHIGMQLAGRIPIRADSDGRLPRPAHDPAAQWTGDIPFDELPATFDPACGFVASANDRLTDRDYPHFISRDWVNPYRATRIRNVLEASSSTTIADHARLQLDLHSLAGAAFVDALRKHSPRPRTGDGVRALAAILGWDHELTAESEGGAVYGTVMDELRSIVFGFLGELAPGLLGSSRGPAGGTYPTMYGRTTPRLIHDIACDDLRLLTHAAAHDLQAGTSWNDVLATALDRSGARLARASGRSSTWQWGDVHKIRVAHALGFVPGAHAVLSRGPWPIGGDLDTVAQASLAPKVHNDAAIIGPSQRMVIDLANPDASVGVLCGGQSGHPASPHYADQLELWRGGKLRPMPCSRDAITAAAVHRRTFTPA